MSQPPVTLSAPSLPLRDRLTILAILGVISLLCWVYLIQMSSGMGVMMMSGSMMEIPLWTSSYFSAMLLMWVIMMIGMMIPSAIPMVLIFAAVARRAEGQGTHVPTYAFVLGYVITWSLFSLAATLAQWYLDEAALLSPMMVANSPVFGASLLLVAGLYQLTPMKNACLKHCRSPAHFIAEKWKPGRLGALQMGLEHGAFCLGCCWILMGLLFFGGVMSLLWIAGITLFVLLEKIIPHGIAGGRLAGVGMTLFGLVLLGFSLLF
jgi:predicted metal-binding membrane protein